MLDSGIQMDILLFYYDLWEKDVFKRGLNLKDFVNKQISRDVLETNANYLIDKGLLAPFQTYGLYTYLTPEGVFYVESKKISTDISLRYNILKKIKEKYDQNPLEYANLYELQKILGITFNEMQRNIQILEYIGAIRTRKVIGGYQEAEITANGLDLLKRPTVVESESIIMATAYSKLYLLENYIRCFLENKLYEKYKDEWWSKGVPYKIKLKAEENKNKEKRDKSYIYYLDFGDLRKIIQYEENWSSIFSEIFKIQTGIISRLEELEPIRHSIAHTRMLNNDELLKIELFFKEIPEIIGIPQKQNHARVS